MENIDYKNDENITVSSDAVLFDISYYKDEEYFKDMMKFVKFIKAVEHNVRKHPDYDQIVSTVREEYMEHCQVLGNVNRYDATIELHHGPALTLFDYCAIVTNSFIKRKKKINTFRIANAVMDEHLLGNVQFVMLSKTVHQMIDSGELFISMKQAIGDVNTFLKKYKDGLDDMYIDKINRYIDMSKKYDSTDNGIFDLEENMVNWSYR